MPPITALLHATNDSLRLGRTLEMLLPCVEILIVHHDSADGTRRIAREYGARIVTADRNSTLNRYLDQASHDWILCMQPGESITESLQASLFEWRALPRDGVVGVAFSVCVRQQTGEIWRELPGPEIRLIPRNWNQWHERLPAHNPTAVVLEGKLLRFDFP
jgi:hypothetical protein